MYLQRADVGIYLQAFVEVAGYEKSAGVAPDCEK